MSLIINNLYIGNWYDASNHVWLHTKNIKYILNCAKELPCPYTDCFTYKHVLLDDTPDQDILQYKQDVINFIDNAMKTNSPIFVHCAAGISRSVSMVMFYLLHLRENNKLFSTGSKFHKCLKIIRDKRPIARPNSGFENQLRSL